MQKGECLQTSPAVGTLAAILGDVGSLVTNSIDWVGDFVTVITGNPLLEMFVITSFVGLGVGLIRRIIRL